MFNFPCPYLYTNTKYKNKNLSVDNIKLFSFDIARIDMVFCGADVVDRIYINFPNPWPKDSHKKRRLTHTRQLFKYRTFLKQGGEILFKTDDDELYHDTVEYLRLSGFKIEENIESLYENGIPKDTVITEHEKMFFDEGLKIVSSQIKCTLFRQQMHTFSAPVF